MDSQFPNGLSAKLAQGVRVNTDRAKGAAALARGPNKGVQLKSAPWSGTWPAPGATLDLDFANNRGFVRGVGMGGAMDAVTFTRASNGTFVGSDGKLAGSGGNQGALGNNLLTFPQDFDNAAWTKTRSSINANVAIAPDNTLTADKLIEDTSNNSHVCIQTITTAAGTYTVSVYAQASERSRVVVSHQNSTGLSGAYAVFNLLTGVVDVSATIFGSGYSAASASISSIGNGWYRCAVTATTTASAVSLSLNLDNATSGALSQVYQGNGTSGIFIWGAQLELGSTATTYYPTNINAPRFDWASTATVANKNLLTYTEQFDNAAWTKSGFAGFGSGSVANTTATTDPLGGNTADFLLSTAVAGYRYVYQAGVATSAGVTYTVSMYVKAGGYSYFAISDLTSGARYAFFDLNNGTFSLKGTNADVTLSNQAMTDVGNGWYRCSVTYSSALGRSITFYQLPNSTQTPSGVWTGDGVSGQYYWGGQIELGSTLTAYQAVSQSTTNTPLAAASTCNGLLIEESRTNRILWCRDASQAPNRNLFAYSQQFNNSYWTKSNSTITADSFIAPDGSTTADTMYENTVNNVHTLYNTTAIAQAANTTYTVSVSIKPINTTFFTLTYNSGTANNFVSATFDAVTGAVTKTGVGSSSGTVVSTSITSEGNGWFRCSLTASINATTSYCGFTSTNTGTPIYDSSGNPAAFVGNTANGFALWGAQLERGSALSVYEPTTTTGAIWSKLDVTAAKNQEGIDGVANAATSITASAANGTLIQPIVLASGSRTGSVYLKRITGTGNVQVSLDGSTWSTVELSTERYYRIAISGTVTNPVIGIRLATNGDAVAMDYAQVEDGAFATTPILTTSATATRSADVASISGANFLSFYNQSGGTVFCNATQLPPAINRDVNIWTMYGTANFDPFIRYTRSFSFGSGGFDIFVNGSYFVRLDLPGSFWTSGINQKAAASFSRNEALGTSNGSVLNTFSGRSGNRNLPNMIRLTLGEYNGSYSSLWISRLTYSPTQQTGNVLQELTK